MDLVTCPDRAVSRRPLLLCLAAAAVLATACAAGKKTPAPTKVPQVCADLAIHVAALATPAWAEARQEEVIGKLRASCEAAPPPAPVVACAMNASTRETLEACDDGTLPKVDIEPTCDELSRHIVELMLRDPNIPVEAKEMKDTLRREMRAECERDTPPAASMRCMVAAPDMTELDRCSRVH